MKQPRRKITLVFDNTLHSLNVQLQPTFELAKSHSPRKVCAPGTNWRQCFAVTYTYHKPNYPMAGLEFKAPEKREQEDAAVVAHNTRIGLVLFAFYVALYAGFMALSAFRPAAMSRPFLGGANLAVVYGFALIGAAIVLALLYMRICRKSK